uniref:Uncharacterized protein n=1 Tax=Pyxicephalus adspersus TaxID=30357 RepID=A0AAV2ZNG2_PYXAD|nr:TPA: hypothetical protein GDO54_004803 [Pyxicephalus adspersus]
MRCMHVYEAVELPLYFHKHLTSIREIQGEHLHLFQESTQRRQLNSLSNKLGLSAELLLLPGSHLHLLFTRRHHGADSTSEYMGASKKGNISNSGISSLKCRSTGRGGCGHHLTELQLKAYGLE